MMPRVTSSITDDYIQQASDSNMEELVELYQRGDNDDDEDYSNYMQTHNASGHRNNGVREFQSHNVEGDQILKGDHLAAAEDLSENLMEIHLLEQEMYDKAHDIVSGDDPSSHNQ